jgi:hypothetical protein
LASNIRSIDAFFDFDSIGGMEVANDTADIINGDDTCVDDLRIHGTDGVGRSKALRLLVITTR